MSLIALKDIPPWEWPQNVDKMILEVLANDKADGSERLLAVEMAGDAPTIH